jgi:hypothetical protein
MGTIVSSVVTKAGATIFSGNIRELVVVKTAPGYAPDPNVPGTGTVFAVICQM